MVSFVVAVDGVQDFAVMVSERVYMKCSSDTGIINVGGPYPIFLISRNAYTTTMSVRNK